MRRFVLTTLFSLLAILVLAAPVGADGWCQADPIVRLNGTTLVQVLVAIPVVYVPLVDDPTRVEMKTPQQVQRELLYVDAGFNGKGEDFSFSDIGGGNMTATQYRVWIKVTVPVDYDDGDVPVRVTVIPSNGPTQVFFGDHKGTELTMWINR